MADRPAHTPPERTVSIDDGEIEVTPEMVEAGVSELMDWEYGFYFPDEAVVEVFRAMVRDSIRLSPYCPPLRCRDGEEALSSLCKE